MMPDAYEGFADRYDLFVDDFGGYNKERVEFFRRLLEDHKVKTVLDCACGTGRDLVMLDGLGVNVTGADVSPAMLAQARKNLSARGMEIPLHKVDFRELPHHFSERFDAVVCLSSSLLEAGKEDQVLRALRSMHGVLRAGGLLVMSQGTTDMQWREKPRFIPVVNRPDFSRVFAIDYLGRGARFNVLDLFHGAGRNELVVWSREYPVMLLRDDYQTLLGEAGFGEISFYGSYTFEAYDKTRSGLLLAVARKAG
jgi:SAM-dependent methyltransferase